MALARFTFRGVTYRYDDHGATGSLRVDRGIGNMRISVTYRVPWLDRIRAAANLLGKTTFVNVPDALFGYFRRQLPHAHPEGVGFDEGPTESWVFCTRANYIGHIRRETRDDSLPGHLDALIEATYEGLPYHVRPDNAVGDIIVPPLNVLVPVDESTLQRYVSHPCPEDKSRVKADKSGRWIFADTGDLISDAFFTTLVEETHIFIWHQVIKTNIPYGSIAAIKAGCNDEEFAGFQPQQLVFTKYSIKELPRMPDGKLGVDVMYYFDHFPRGANRLPDPKRGGFWAPVEAADTPGQVPYPPVNFNYLFRPVPTPVGVVV